MQRNRVALLFLGFLVAVCAPCVAFGQAAAPFAVTAANLTMPAYDPPTVSGGVTATHLGSSSFTVTGIEAGTLTIACQYSGPATQAKIPQQCGIVGPGQLPVQPGETTASGVVYFVPYGEGPVPGLAQLQNPPRPSGRLPLTAIALSGALMLGFGFRRRARRGLLLALLTACSLLAAAGLTGCAADNENAMTPGTYSYTISAGFTATGSNAVETATTTITLTVH